MKDLPALVRLVVLSKITFEPVTVKVPRFVRLKVAPLKVRVRFDISNVVVPVAETENVPLKSAVSARVSEPFAPIWTLLKPKPALVRLVVPSKITVEPVIMKAYRLVKLTFPAKLTVRLVVLKVVAPPAIDVRFPLISKLSISVRDPPAVALPSCILLNVVPLLVRFVVPLKMTVPPLALKDPPETVQSPETRNVPLEEGAVRVPLESVTLVTSTVPEEPVKVPPETVSPPLKL